MAINPLQLPQPIKQPEIDWGRLDVIGDSIMRIRQDQAERDAIDKAISSSTAAPAMGVMSGRPMMPHASGAPTELDALVHQTAQKHGLEAQHLRRFVQLESGGRPDAVSPSGRHGGLLQLDMEDFAKRGGKNINDPAENLEIGAQRLRENKEALRRRLGRDPSPTELYLAHQQGLGGVAAHMAAPAQAAWKSMLSTAEGQARAARDPAGAERWAKAAVWGNVPDALKARFGSVDRVTSGDFMTLWQGRVEGADRAMAQGGNGAAPRVDSRQLTEAQAQRLRAIAATGPVGRRQVQEFLLKQTMARDPIKLGPDETLLDPNTYQPLARGAPRTPVDRSESEQAKINTRIATAQRLGWDPRDPQTQVYIATGKHPGEDRVSPTSLKLIKEAEDDNNNLNETQIQLTRALELNDQIFTGFGANTRRYLGTQLPDWMVPDALADPKQAQLTEEFQKIMDPEAISVMANTLKGATTDFELRTFVKLLSDPSTTPATRKRVLERMLRLASTQHQVNQTRMDQIRGGTYTKPGGGQSTTQQGTVTREMAERARRDPEAARSEARRAIEAGADRNQVIRRLQQLRVPTDGL